MKTFEAFFEYRIKDDHGSRFAHACVRVEAKDDTDAERKISELLQRAVGEPEPVTVEPDPWIPLVADFHEVVEAALVGEPPRLRLSKTWRIKPRRPSMEIGDASMAGPELLAVAQSYVDGSVAPARTTPSVIYKLRAECWVDAARLLLRLCPDRAEVVHLELGEVQVLLENPSNRRDDGRRGRPLSLEELRYTIRESVPDSHVMIETLRTADEYTGERTYGKEAR